MHKSTLLGPVILDLEALSLTAEDKALLHHPEVGGVIFFKRNFENPKQLRSLVNEIRAIRPQLLLCVDQEGGRVQRFIEGMTRLPKLRILGEMLDSKAHSLDTLLNMAEKLGLLMATEIRALDVDLSFAPVLDLDRGLSEIIGDRAFHHDPQIVAALAGAYIKGMAKAGMRATGKHFPGHGAVTLDSHLGLPVDTRPMLEIEEDMQPFRLLIQQKLSAIMPAHIVYSAVDQLPVGFSHFWLQTVLRQRLGFHGAIISDDLSMGGAVEMGSYADRTKLALEAGCDYLLVCNNREGAAEALHAAEQVFSGELTQQRRQALLAEGEFTSTDCQSAHEVLSIISS